MQRLQLALIPFLKMQSWPFALRAKQEYRGMFETQKLRKQDKFGRDWS